MMLAFCFVMILPNLLFSLSLEESNKLPAIVLIFPSWLFTLFAWISTLSFALTCPFWLLKISVARRLSRSLPCNKPVWLLIDCAVIVTAFALTLPCTLLRSWFAVIFWDANEERIPESFLTDSVVIVWSPWLNTYPVLFKNCCVLITNRPNEIIPFSFGGTSPCWLFKSPWWVLIIISWRLWIKPAWLSNKPLLILEFAPELNLPCWLIKSCSWVSISRFPCSAINIALVLFSLPLRIMAFCFATIVPSVLLTVPEFKFKSVPIEISPFSLDKVEEPSWISACCADWI